jgi:hypothetical protein
LSPEPELDPDEDEELPESLDELDELDELPDFAASEPESEPEDELSAAVPLDPLAAPSLPAGTVLAPLRLSVR